MEIRYGTSACSSLVVWPHLSAGEAGKCSPPSGQALSHLPTYVCAKSLQLCLTHCEPMDHSPPGSLSWDSPDRNTGVGYHAFLQGISPTQGSNQHLFCLLHWEVSSLPLAPSGKSIPHHKSLLFSFVSLYLAIIPGTTQETSGKHWLDEFSGYILNFLNPSPIQKIILVSINYCTH